MASLCGAASQPAFAWNSRRLLPSRPQRTGQLSFQRLVILHLFATCHRFSKSVRFDLLQVAASLKKDVDAQVPNYTNLPSKIPCLLHNVTLHVCLIFCFKSLPQKSFSLSCSNFLHFSCLCSQADPDTDEVYAQMALRPVPSVSKLFKTVLHATH